MKMCRHRLLYTRVCLKQQLLLKLKDALLLPKQNKIKITNEINKINKSVTP